MSKLLSFSCDIPSAPGAYQVEAALIRAGEPVKVSSAVRRDGQTYSAEFAVDGRADTRWSSEFADPQRIMIDLQKPQSIARIELSWEAAFGKAYQIETSLDGQNWKQVYKTDSGKGGVETLGFQPVSARFVRLTGTKRATPYGYSLWEFKVLEK